MIQGELAFRARLYAPPRFFDRHDITVKKKRRTPASKRDRTWPRLALPGRPCSLKSPSTDWCSSTRRAP